MKNNKQINIPNGWRLAKIGDVGNIISGGTPSTEVIEYWDGEIPWITPTEITKLKTKYIVDTERKITKLGLEKSSAKEIPPMSLIICSRATVGKCAINKNLVTTNQGFKNIIPNKNINIYFLYYYIYTQANQLKRISSGSTFLEFSKFDLEKFKFLLPPKPEQNKIVEVLETWDNYLEKITKKIEIKKNIKKGLMQKLLSGEIRLSGFSGEWERKKLGEICKKGESHVAANTLETNQGDYAVYGASGFIKKIDFFTQNDPYIAIVKDGAGVGRLSLHKQKTSVLGTLNVIIPAGDIELNFLYSLLQKIDFKKYVVGSTIPHIYFKDYRVEKLLIPKIKEQKAIANIFNTADLEIELLKSKKKKIEDQKRYLLNNLITGKIRIPEFQKVK